MNQQVPHSYKNFILGVMATSVTGLLLIILSFVIGKNDFFLLLNADLGPTADVFFRFWTNLGDGIIWVLVLILIYRYHKSKLPLVIASILVSTLITQITKNVIFPDSFRPTAAHLDLAMIHTVTGIDLLSANSFPSGHTASAFSIFLLACLMMKSRWVIFIGFLYAILVGYSRIYLAQHFPLDVGAGMITAVFTLLISIYFQKQWDLKKAAP